MGITTAIACDLVAHVGNRAVASGETSKCFAHQRGDGSVFIACGVCMGNRDPTFSQAVTTELVAMQAADWSSRGAAEAIKLLDAIDSHRANLRKIAATRA